MNNDDYVKVAYPGWTHDPDTMRITVGEWSGTICQARNVLDGDVDEYALLAMEWRCPEDAELSVRISQNEPPAIYEWTDRTGEWKHVFLLQSRDGTCLLNEDGTFGEEDYCWWAKVHFTEAQIRWINKILQGIMNI